MFINMLLLLIEFLLICEGEPGRVLVEKYSTHDSHYWRPTNTLTAKSHAISTSGKYPQTFMTDGLLWVEIELLTSHGELLMETE